MSHQKMNTAVEPLRDLLREVLGRLDTLESKVGITSVPSNSTTTSTTTGTTNTSHPLSSTSSHSVSKATVGGATVTSSTAANTNSLPSVGVPASVKAYDEMVLKTIQSFCALCNDELSTEFVPITNYIVQAFDGIRTMIVLASRSKPPVDEYKQPNDYIAFIQPHIQPTMVALQEIRSYQKMDRKYDIHMKAIYEFITCVSWVYMYNVPSPHIAPLPVPFVKECMSSATFWCNRIRKDHKDNAAYNQFCDTMKQFFMQLIEYISTYHLTGLTFHPKGISLAEAAIRYADEHNNVTIATTTTGSGITSTLTTGNINNTNTGGGGDMVEDGTTTTGSPKRTGPHPTLGSNVIVGGNVVGIIGELSKRTNADGTSAATGLKKVR
jgi:serine acetyltransferase